MVKNNFLKDLCGTLFATIVATEYLFVLSLFLGIIVCAPIVYFVPYMRYIFIVFLIIFLFFYFLYSYFQTKNLFVFQSLIICFIIIQMGLSQFRQHDADLAPFIAMLIASLFIWNTNKILNLLKIVVILNFIAMVYEVLSEKYIINIILENQYEFGRMQGLFSYSKEAGYFILISFLFVRYFNNSFILKIILLFSSVLSGSRTSMLFILIIMLIDYIYITCRHINIVLFINRCLCFAFIIVFGIIISKIYFTNENEYMLFRILSSFDFESSSQAERLLYWNEYIKYILNYNFFCFLFGNGAYVDSIVGNGAESTYLMIISQQGIFGLLLFLIPLFLVVILFFLNRLNFIQFL